jgi:sigma-B regulation protein RsbU (phosphoserine phosphatase)
MSADETTSGCGELYDGAACGLLSTGRDGTIEQVNRTFCQWIGYSREELIGVRKLQDLLTVGGKIFHQTHWMPLLQIQGSVAEIALEMMRADQRTVPMLMNAIRRERDGVVSHDIALFISEDRRAYEREILHARLQAEEALAEQLRSQRALELAEQRLRLTVEVAQLCLWVGGERQGERVFDERAALLLGHATPRAVGADDFAAAVEPSDAPFPKPECAESSELYRHEYRFNGVDGIQRTILETGRALVVPGAPVRHVGVLQDITEISRQRAAAEDRALFAQQMIGIASHDLRNPLSAITLGSDMLLGTSLDGRQQRYAQAIGQAARRAHRMVDDLLDFTAIRIGRGLSFKIVPVDLQALVARCVEELRMAFPDRDIRHRHQGEGPCAADPDRLVQLIGNLVANALKYGVPGGAVTVDSILQADAFSVAVHNDGTPIPPELMADLFEPMSRGEFTADADRNVGLGLFIVRVIARDHGGKVMVESTAQTGTIFTVHIPLTAASTTEL